jgi:hypothetical protein
LTGDFEIGFANMIFSYSIPEGFRSCKASSGMTVDIISKYLFLSSLQEAFILANNETLLLVLYGLNCNAAPKTESIDG